MLSRLGDGVIMALEHERLPIAAVQFHPESLMTLKEEVGFRIVQNVVRTLVARPRPKAVAS